MREGRPSRTAEQNALFRALEGLRPSPARVCDDALARHFLTWPLSLVLRLAAVPGGVRFVAAFIDRRWPGVRSSVVARTRLIDDVVGALEGDVEQLVILGAGYDSRAYRLPRLRSAAVFEVDHPDTQAAKQRVLRRCLGAPPAHVRFVAVDFTCDDLTAAMQAAGYRASARSMILWEGVTNYLTEASVDSTLRWCSRAAVPESLLLFTYVHRDIIDRPEAFVGTKNLFASLDKAGERFTFGLEPSHVPQYLAERGLSLERDLGAAEYRERYFGDAARRMRGHEFYRVAWARLRG